MTVGATKPFDPVLAEWSSRAERELRNWLRKHGYEYSQFPDGKCGVDGQAESGWEKFLVEVERVGPERWPGEFFPFDTYHVLERRREKLEGGAVLFAIRHDIRRAFAVFPSSITADRLKPIFNEMCKGEYAFHVPFFECCPLDLTDGGGDSIAVINAKRIRQRARDAVSPKGRMLVLHDWPPYGMSEEEWRELRDDAERPIAAAALCPCRRNDRSVWVESKENGCIKTRCKLCGAWIGCRPS